VVLIVFVRRLLPYPRAEPPAPRYDTRNVMGFALPLWASGLLNRFRRNIETFVLGALSIAADVGVFAIATRVNAVAHIGYRAVIVSVKPLLARAFAAGERQVLSSLYSTTTRWTLTMSLPFLLPMVLYPEPILALFGADFVDGAPALVVLALAELVVAATGTCGSMIDMAGHTRVKIANSVIWVALVTVTSILLIPPYGVLGAALASMISTTLVNLLRLVEVWILDRLQPYRADFLKVVAAAGLAFVTGIGLDALMPHGDRLGLVTVYAVVVVAVYLLGLTVFGLHPDDRMLMRRMLHRFAGSRRVDAHDEDEVPG
jgi:O-antigen/teichoic acid export membrane protein